LLCCNTYRWAIAATFRLSLTFWGAGRAGDAVVVDDVVLQIETDKVTLDVRSPYNGKLIEFLLQEGDTVTVGLPLFTIDQSAGA
jgi:multidrug efflux pump subunit AcrA (membrane-fusion protein)